MAKNRFINTKFWSDNFIIDLNPLDRYLFLYFLTNEHTNICGIYELPLKRMSDETGIEKDMLLKMLKRMKGKIYYIDGWVYIRNFAKHQTDGEKIRIGIANGRKLVPEKILQKIELLDKKIYSTDTLSIHDELLELESEPELELELESESEHIAKQSSAEIAEMIDSFKVVNQSYQKWFANKTQRSACERLIKLHGLPQLKKVIAILPKTNKMNYIPTITTPLQLEDKWASLESNLQKKKKEETSRIII